MEVDWRGCFTIKCPWAEVEPDRLDHIKWEKKSQCLLGILFGGRRQQYFCLDEDHAAAVIACVMCVAPSLSPWAEFEEVFKKWDLTRACCLFLLMTLLPSSRSPCPILQVNSSAAIRDIWGHTHICVFLGDQSVRVNLEFTRSLVTGFQPSIASPWSPALLDLWGL